VSADDAAREIGFCPSCRMNVVATIEPGPGEDEARGRRCPLGHHWWAKKTENEGLRSDRNAHHRRHWRRRQDGEMQCHWCGVVESQTRAGFEIDHVHPLEDGGSDEFENTRPLCRDCHTVRNAMRAHARHLAGKSARSEVEVNGESINV